MELGTEGKATASVWLGLGVAAAPFGGEGSFCLLGSDGA